MEKTINFQRIPSGSALSEQIQPLVAPFSIEIRQGEQKVREDGYFFYPIHEFLEVNSIWELSALLENARIDKWIKDEPFEMDVEELCPIPTSYDPEPSLSAAERNPSLV